MYDSNEASPLLIAGFLPYVFVIIILIAIFIFEDISFRFSFMFLNAQCWENEIYV